MRIINIDKPKGWTSFDVVRLIKRKFKENKVGHLGTLDPMATGVLPVFLGKATRLIPLFNESDKTYRAVCKLGESTDTFDAEGSVTNNCETRYLNSEEIKKTVKLFQGKQLQETPAFSATKFNGIPAYKLARQGLKIPSKKKSIIFHKLMVESIDLPYVQIWISCSKGTYIRSFANDLGHFLKVGAHLTSLERLSCGEWFRSDNSVSVEKLGKMDMENKIPWIFPSEILCHFYSLAASSKMVADIKHGRAVQISEMTCINENLENKENISFTKENTPKQAKVTDSNHNLVAIGQIIWENDMNFFKPSKVFI